MSSVGEKLRHERESRDASIEQLAAGTGVGAQFLAAMERDDFDALPGRAFGKLYIRAYAEYLEFDPVPLIEEYDRAQRALPESARRPTRWKPESPPPEVAEVDELSHDDEPSTEEHLDSDEPYPIEIRVAKPLGMPRTIALVAAGTLVVVTLAWVGLRGIVHRNAQRDAAADLRAAADPPPVAAPAEPTLAPAPAPSADPTPLPAPSPIPTPARSASPKKAVPPPDAAGPLTIEESGIGGRVVDSRLADHNTEFVPGQSVYFWTHVRGGRAGQSIKHVWRVNGRVEQSITLRVGGSDWRTYSTKKPLRTGAWTVEARDAAGTVLASGSFTCEDRKD